LPPLIDFLASALLFSFSSVVWPIAMDKMVIIRVAIAMYRFAVHSPVFQAVSLTVIISA
jgi:hypothetical protein